MINVHFGATILKIILLVTGVAMSASRIVEDGVIKIGGLELGRTKSLLVMSVEWRIGERDLVIAFFTIENGLRNG